MPRRILIRSEQHPYHITTRVNNKEVFHISLREVWRICKILLKDGTNKFDVKIEAFVLMNNHYHLIIRTPRANIDKFMHYFNRQLSIQISKRAGRINRLFGSPYHWKMITSQSYYLNAVRYVYQNPLRAKIVGRVQDYPYSDIRNQKSYHKYLDWFNTRYEEDEIKLIKKNI